MSAARLQQIGLAQCHDLRRLVLNADSLVRLNLQHCANLHTLDLTGCPALSDLNLVGCRRLANAGRPLIVQALMKAKRLSGIRWVHVYQDMDSLQGCQMYECVPSFSSTFTGLSDGSGRRILLVLQATPAPKQLNSGWKLSSLRF